MLVLLCLVYATTNVETVQQKCHMEPTNHSFSGVLHISLRADIKQCKRECLLISSSQCSGQRIERDEFSDHDTINFLRKCRRRTEVQTILLTKACFKEFHGRVLVGVVDEFYENVSRMQCRKACAISLIQNNVFCKAAIYYPKEKECIISSQNRFDLPELFIEDAAAVYLENRCADNQFLNTAQNKIDAEKPVLPSISARSFFKNEQLSQNNTNNVTLNIIPKKPVKEVAKHIRPEPLQNIEMSGYEMSFEENLRPFYPLYAEHKDSNGMIFLSNENRAQMDEFRTLRFVYG
ncbi:PAN domain family protein [Brugia pahangi]